MAIVEALSQGVPVVISKECNFDEVASSNAGIICQLNAGSISDGIIKIYSEPELRKTMSRNAISLVSDDYTWDKISKKVCKVYLDAGNPNI